MDIKRVDTLAQAAGKPLIEVRQVEPGRFVLSLWLGDEADIRLRGPFHTSASAELYGITAAEVGKLTEVYIVHTS
jgi:hypothetical protein